jgi:hypothetical protein
MELFHPAVTSSLVGSNILLSTLFSNTLNTRMCSSFNVIDKIITTIKIYRAGIFFLGNDPAFS